MKIIFDSEEQKSKFIGIMAGCSCPHELGLGPTRDLTECEITCEDCWKNCALQMEVKGCF